MIKNKININVIIISIGAVLVNLFLLYLYYSSGAKGLAGDETGYITRATLLAEGKDVVRLTIWPPGYDYFLSVPIYFSKFIHFIPTLLMAQIFQMIVWAVGLYFYWKIVKVLITNDRVRLVAFALFALNPTLIAYSHYFWPEVVHLTVYLTVFWLLICHKPTAFSYCAIATLLAISLLLKSVYLPITVFIFLFLFIFRFRNRLSQRPNIIAIVIFLGILVPTLLDNYNKHNKVMIADSSLFNAWVGLNDTEITDWNKNSIVAHEFGVYLNTAETHNERNAIYLEKIKDLVIEQGVYNTVLNQFSKQYFRLFDHKTFFTKQLPGGMNEKYNFRSTYLASFLRLYNDVFWAATLFFFTFGVISCFKKEVNWLQFLLLIILYNCALFLFFHVKTRYVIQFFPLLTILSAIGFCNANYILRTAWKEKNIRKAVIIFCSTLVSCFLLYVAFIDLIGS